MLEYFPRVFNNIRTTAFDFFNFLFFLFARLFKTLTHQGDRTPVFLSPRKQPSLFSITSWQRLKYCLRRSACSLWGEFPASSPTGEMGASPARGDPRRNGASSEVMVVSLTHQSPSVSVPPTAGCLPPTAYCWQPTDRRPRQGGRPHEPLHARARPPRAGPRSSLPQIRALSRA